MRGYPLTLKQKIGQLLVININQDQTEAPDCGLIHELAPGGILLQPGNVVNPEQLRALSISLQECARQAGLTPLLIAIDHEGEYVNRYDYGATKFPSALALAAGADKLRTHETCLAAGQELRYSGVNVILGPVADVLTNMDNKVIDIRSYGGHAGEVADHVELAVSGYQRAGLITALKHFPGHGGVSADSHKTLPVDPTDRVGLEARYLPPFLSGIAAGAEVVMLSHVAFPEISGEQEPASLSPEVVALLRQDLGFDGVIISDAMNMKAVTGEGLPVPHAALRSILAGVDLLLVSGPGKARATHRHLSAAYQAGELPHERLDEALGRVLKLKEEHDLLYYPLDLPEEAPDWDANQALALKAGEQAVGVLKDEAGYVPLPPEYEKILVVAPRADDWYFYPSLKESLTVSGRQVDFVFFPSPWEGVIQDEELLQNLPTSAPDYDLILIFTWQSHINSIVLGDPWQIQMVNGLFDTGLPLVVVAMKSPIDIQDFPRILAYLSTFGTNSGAMDHLIEVLVSGKTADGINPLPDLTLFP